MRPAFLLLAAALLLATSSAATVYTVLPDGSGDFPTIQAGVEGIDHGDVLELGDGTFSGPGNCDVDYMGKLITIRSQGGNPDNCIINCAGSVTEPHRGFHFHSGESSASVLSGVTITQGWESDDLRGGCIRCEDGSSPVISNCVLTYTRGAAALCIDGGHLQLHACVLSHNDAFEGGGVCCEEATLTLEGCRFFENTADQLGGAVHAHAAVIEMVDCEFENNSALHGGATDFHIGSVVTARNCRYYENSAIEAGCLCLFAGCDGTIEGCTFYGNTCTDWASALAVGKSSMCHVQSCTFYGNTGGSGAVLLSDAPCTMAQTVIAFNGGGLYEYSTVTMTCCDIFGNQGGDWIGSFAGQYGIDGNISEDPLFCDPELRDLRLNAASPCAPFSPPNPECDLIGAWPVGCGGTPVEGVSWGRLKAAFR